jgi:hypothetical protein
MPMIMTSMSHAMKRSLHNAKCGPVGVGPADA